MRGDGGQAQRHRAWRPGEEMGFLARMGATAGFRAGQKQALWHILGNSSDFHVQRRALEQEGETEAGPWGPGGAAAAGYVEARWN